MGVLLKVGKPPPEGNGLKFDLGQANTVIRWDARSWTDPWNAEPYRTDP